MFIFRNLVVVWLMVFATPVLGREMLLIAMQDVDFAPYQYFEDNEMRGIHIEMIQGVANQLNYDIEFVRLPWNRLVRVVESGKVDGLSYMGSHQPDTGDFTWFHGGNALSVTASRLMVTKQSKLKFNGQLSEFDGKVIGVLRGFQYGGQVLENAKFEIIAADGVEHLKLLLDRGRIDAAIVMQSEWINYKKNGSDKYKILSRPVATIWVYLGFSKAKYGELFSHEFSIAMQEFLNTSEYQNIINKYITPLRQ